VTVGSSVTSLVTPLFCALSMSSAMSASGTALTPASFPSRTGIWLSQSLKSGLTTAKLAKP